jgi:hypothetical protein
MNTFFQLFLHFMCVLAITIPIGYWLSRTEKRHAARMRAYLIEKYGECPNETKN